MEWGDLYPCIDSKGGVFVGTDYGYFFRKGYDDSEIILVREISHRVDVQDRYEESFCLSQVTYTRIMVSGSGKSSWIASGINRKHIADSFNNALWVVYSVLNGKRECDYAFSTALQELMDRYGSVA